MGVRLRIAMNGLIILLASMIMSKITRYAINANVINEDFGYAIERGMNVFYNLGHLIYWVGVISAIFTMLNHIIFGQ